MMIIKIVRHKFIYPAIQVFFNPSILDSCREWIGAPYHHLSSFVLIHTKLAVIVISFAEGKLHAI